MKCAQCGGDFTHDTVRQRYGTTHYADYGCCSKECYEGRMTGVPPMPNPESQNEN